MTKASSAIMVAVAPAIRVVRLVDREVPGISTSAISLSPFTAVILALCRWKPGVRIVTVIKPSGPLAVYWQ